MGKAGKFVGKAGSFVGSAGFFVRQVFVGKAKVLGCVGDMLDKWAGYSWATLKLEISGQSQRQRGETFAQAADRGK